MAAKIVAVYNQKGGCGKSMTSMQLGGAFGLRKLRTLVVDMDEQGTSSIWSAQATEEDPFPARVVSMAIQQESMVGEVKKFINDFDIILIDCPPAIKSRIPWAALNIADFGLIPVTPFMDNIWASRAACDLGLLAQQENPSLELAFMVSMFRRGRLLDICLDKLKENQRIPILNSVISLRNAFPESQVYGASVHALGRKLPATLEVEALADELLKKLKVSAKGKKHG